tara:strand:- start:49222 stop:49509 length:288 start_codon:yes stop_codon:yes gene_type:complete
MNRTFYRLLFVFTVVTHHIGLWVITLSVPLLFINEPIWIALPLSAWIMHLALNRLDCPYTRLENNLRRKLDMEEISTFISHYYKKPYHRMVGKNE